MTEQQQNRPAGMDTWIRRRKTYIIDRKMQYTYIAMVVSMVLVMIIGIAVSNAFMMWMYHRVLVQRAGPRRLGQVLVQLSVDAHHSSV